MANRVAAVIVVVVAVAATVVSVSFLRTIHGNSPATAPTTASPKINPTPEVPGVERKQPKFKAPVPDFGSLSTQRVLVSHILTFPLPKTWDGPTGEEWRQAYTDRTTCTAASSLCPHVEFIDQGAPEGRKLVGKDPVKWWVNQPCAGGAKQKVEGPLSLKLGGESAKLYRVRCGAELVYDYAWYVPGKKLLIAGVSGSQGALVPATAQAVVERLVWTS